METLNCEIKQQNALKVIQITTRAPMDELAGALGKIYMSVIQYLQEIGENCSGPAFACYRNSDMSSLLFDAGYVVDKDIPEKGNMKMGTIPQCKVASHIHVGPYTGLPQKYEMLMQWAKDQGLEITGIGYEFYFNDPRTTPQKELRTEIAFPVK